MNLFKYFIIALFLLSCNAKQDFDNDLTVPPVLKEYHKKKIAQEPAS